MSSPSGTDMNKMMQEFIEMMQKNKVDLETAIKKAMSKVDAVMLHYLENCINCAGCAPACPFYEVGPEYSPVNKAEEVRKIYRKEMTIAGKILGKLVGAEKPTEEDIDRLMDLAYACTNCGHCYYTCMVGIHSGKVVGLLKSILTATGNVPTLLAMFEALEVYQMYKQVPGLMQVWQSALEEAQKVAGPIEFDKKFPKEDIGKPKVFFLGWLTDAMMMREGFISTIKILNKLKEGGVIDWTMWSVPEGIRAPISVVIGNSENAVKVVSHIAKVIDEYNPDYVVMMDGGFVYPTWRFEMYGTIIKSLGKKPEWKIIHITELLDELLKEGKIKFEKSNDAITWHDPCQLGRHSGVYEPPRNLLKAASTGYRDLPHNREMNYCCGGGGGIGCILREVRLMMSQIVGMDIKIPPKEEEFERNVEKKHLIAVRRKMEDIKKSGADIVATACPACIETIARGVKHYGKEMGISHVKVIHISEYLADKLKVVG
ncbi:4Fe-4S ferredoxin [Ignicoccus islandicus DSM 13165]|uniref:4Fe-4S ferredoxin n=1 Tax=Ignicoccus islandicus DSM 13165 TaxID=940295 RepID=A0A0U3F5L8_9CREN|nr:(Fe-S)-binding protein [Ignicoccus islandicus]ALU11368.1 4Fe-4S ferredoxin [Ignicoccus islandicus DSM 13165]